MTLSSSFSAGLKAAGALALCALLPVQAVQAEEPSRIVSIGGAVTEIVYALGQEDRLVARDTTSNFPAKAAALPNVGYARALSPEGVLSVDPDLILASEGSGPPETLAVLKQAGVTYVEVPEIYSAAGVIAKIQTVADALDQSEAGQALITQVSDELSAAQALAQKTAGDSPKRVLFVLSTQAGRITASGTGTGADGIITMAGAVNAISEFEGYKQLTDEAIAAAAPDVILAMDRGGDHGLTKDSIQSLPALMLTPAAQNGELIRMDGALLLQFGPRAASAVKDLSQAIYGAAQ
ncbi:hemin ABC transporter substrate-binding protein [Pseudophaeobacter sp. EL27]|uniref:heme/hemin ABC transporter substrate-binding protein n=1 Tax=Pseudophaeobacter sp. EL27 TaxID=2107580 RepID=UPI000EFA99C2|nr:ABC transporter substrate-binding protein [Pseudophaeobacter sp. EL27]